ncbi:MAG: hypothetical protein H5T59_11020 [Anaerolineae bacterium]|nr:hypothetical protein [Anaerolineae bacterium]
MVPERHLQVLRELTTRLADAPFPWAVTGSLGMALQGVPVDVHDVDIQTDRAGAYAIASLFSGQVALPVQFRSSERVQSHFGALTIHGVKVDVMGDLQKRLSDGTWEDPVRVEEHRQWVQVAGMRVPVLSLAYEYRAYLLLGRVEKAALLREWLRKQGRDPEAR